MTVQAEGIPAVASFDEESHVQGARGLLRHHGALGRRAKQMRRILGSPPERTFYAWKAGKARRVPEDTLRRIGYVAGHL